MLCRSLPCTVRQRRAVCKSSSLDSSYELDAMLASLAQSSIKKKRETMDKGHRPHVLQLPHSHDHDLSHPSLSDFNVMLSLLKDWKAAYGSCIVPHRCFDDQMGLGAWVRWMRRQRRTSIPVHQWKVMALDEIGFVWSVPREEAKWHANYHHLRHWKALRWDGGLSSGDIPIKTVMADPRLGWSQELDAWLVRQGKDLVSGRLSDSKRRALEVLGVTLSVKWEDFERGVSVQGLNSHERKRLRQLWRATKVEEAEPQAREGGACDLSQSEEERAERELGRRERARRRWVRAEAARASRLNKHLPLLPNTQPIRPQISLQPPPCDGE